MRIDGDQRIKISVWKKRQPSILEVNLSDPVSFRPLAMGTHASLLWPYATMTGWMVKHMPPAFSFTKTRHRRYVLLLDRIIYTFKNDNPKQDFREFFELTQNTNIFVTNQFPSILFCLEIQRTEDGRTWYLQAEDANNLKLWMERLKKTVQWLKFEESGVLTRDKLDTVILDTAESPAPIRPSISTDSIPSPDKARFSTYNYNYTAPPQPPPPQGPPPPIPSYCYYPEHQISAEHLAATEQLGSPTSTYRRPSRLPDILPPQLPPPTCTLPPPPPMR